MKHVIVYRSSMGGRVPIECDDGKHAQQVYNRIRGHRDVEWWMDGELVLYESVDSIHRRAA